MTGTVTLYHNPKCSKSRQTLALLEAEGVKPQIVRYLEEPPGPDALREIVEALGGAAQDIVRPKEQAEEGLPASEDAETLIAQIVAHPRIMQRPIVVTAKGARIGRPPEAVLEILE